MIHAFALVNAFAASWTDTLVRACWQGGLGIALVWLVCRLWPGLPPVPRCLLWSVAYAKLLLGLVWLPPLALPLLPQPSTAPPFTRTAALPEATLQAAPADTRAATATTPAPSVPAGPAQDRPKCPQAPPSRPTLPTIQTWLMTAWLLGVLAGLVRFALAWRRGYSLYSTSRPLTDDLLWADAAELCRRFGLRRVPPLRAVDGLGSPLLLGLGRPIVLLPAFVLTDCARPELRLMLAHELAHLTRRDLIWNCLPLLARLLFFFHPLVWLAGHEWGLAQEIACDALAVQATGTPPSAYGRMLLGIATRRRTPAAFPTLAVAGSRHTLRRRLSAMQHIGTTSRPRLILAAALTALLALGVLPPWRVVAQSTPPQSVSPAPTQKEDAMMEENRAEFASRNAQLDTQLAEILKHVSPAQQKKAQAEAAFLTAEAARSQQHVQMLEQHRAAYVSAHPNRLTDAQIAEVQRMIYLNFQPRNIDEGIRWEQTIKGKLQAHLASARDARSRQGWQRQIAAIDQRRRVAERQIRELGPVIARQEAKVALLPEEQRARVAKLRDYDSEISAYRNIALMGKEVELSFLRQRIAGKLPTGRQNRPNTNKPSPASTHASAAPSRTPLLSIFSRHGPLRVRVFAQDATGRYLILDKLSHGKTLIIPSLTAKQGSKFNFLVYDNRKQVKDWWL